MRLALALPLSLLASIGCQSAPSGSTPKAESSPFAVSICGYIARCVPDALNAFSGGSRASCEASFSCGGVGLEALMQELEFDEQACSREIEHAACGTLQLGSTGLGPRLIPAPGSRCAEPVGTGRGPQRAMGERCLSEQGACAEGLYCKLDQPLMLVHDKPCGVCSARAEVGEPCPLGTSCTQDAFCELETCVAKRPVGNECRASRECLDGSCIDGSCAPNPSLHLVADGAAEGKACNVAGPNDCHGDVTLTCIDGTCAQRPDQGERCQGAGSCRAGLGCVDQRCTAPRRCTATLGAACGPEAGYGCFGGTVCTGPQRNDLRCALPSSVRDETPACGASCLGDGLSCVNGACLSRLGASCSSSFDCNGLSCDRDIAAFCTLTGAGYQCSVPPCDGCGRCAPKADVQACGASGVEKP